MDELRSIPWALRRLLNSLTSLMLGRWVPMVYQMVLITCCRAFQSWLPIWPVWVLFCGPTSKCRVWKLSPYSYLSTIALYKLPLITNTMSALSRWMKPKKPGLIPTLSNTFLSCLPVSHTNSDSPLICIRHQLDTCSNLTQDFHSGHGLCPKWNPSMKDFFPKPNQAFLCLNLPKVQSLIKHVAFWQEGLLCYTKMLRGTLCVYTRHRSDKVALVFDDLWNFSNTLHAVSMESLYFLAMPENLSEELGEKWCWNGTDLVDSSFAKIKAWCMWILFCHIGDKTKREPAALQRSFAFSVHTHCRPVRVGNMTNIFSNCFNFFFFLTILHWNQFVSAAHHQKPFLSTLPLVTV